MGLMDKFNVVADIRRELDEIGIDPFGVQIERVLSPTEGVIQGRPTILAGTNNYLGLTFDPSCIAAACAALEHEGTGTTGSRLPQSGGYTPFRTAR